MSEMDFRRIRSPVFYLIPSTQEHGALEGQSCTKTLPVWAAAHIDRASRLSKWDVAELNNYLYPIQRSFKNIEGEKDRVYHNVKLWFRVIPTVPFYFTNTWI